METVTAKGASGTIYTYHVLMMPVTWHHVPANYMFACRGVAGWRVFYIGQCASAKDRLTDHERWAEAVKLGATHILSHPSSHVSSAREKEERDLIASHGPQLNTHHMPTNALKGLLG